MRSEILDHFEATGALEEMNEKDFDKIYEKRYFGENDFVEDKDATKWL